MPVDLGSDRPATPVAVPAPPRGGSIGFVFGDERRGWVTHIPDSLQLPAVAYGDGKLYVSGGFETYSFYALDADEGRIAWVSAELPDNGPTAPIYEDDRVIFNTESCTLVALAAKTGKVLWTKWLGDPTLAQVAVADGPGVRRPSGPTAARALSAYRVTNGEHVWTRAVDGELYATPVVAGDSVYVVDPRRARASASGRRPASVDLVAPRCARPPRRSSPTASCSSVGARAAARRSRRLAGDGRRPARARGAAAPYLADVPRDLDNWKQVWAFEGSRPVMSRGVRYVARGGVIQAADPAERRPLLDPDATPRRRARRSVGSVAVAGSQLVVSTRTGQLFGLDVDTGYTLWAYDSAHPVVAQTDRRARLGLRRDQPTGWSSRSQVADPTLDGWHMFGGNPRHNGPVTGGST